MVSTGSINVELEELDAAVMLSQVAGEYEEKLFMHLLGEST